VLRQMGKGPGPWWCSCLDVLKGSAAVLLAKDLLRQPLLIKRQQADWWVVAAGLARPGRPHLADLAGVQGRQRPWPPAWASARLVPSVGLAASACFLPTLTSARMRLTLERVGRPEPARC